MTRIDASDLAACIRLLDTRLRELDAEWDIERVLETNAAALAFTGVGLAAFATSDGLFSSAPADQDTRAGHALQAARL